MSDKDRLLSSIWNKRPLKFQAFLPIDNNPDPTSNGFVWLQYAEQELSWLLTLKFPKFVSYLIYDPKLRLFIDSFLRYRFRPYDYHINKKINDNNETTKKLLLNLDKRIFFIFLRLTSQNEIKLLMNLSIRIDENQVLNEKNWGNILESLIITFPKILDLASLYNLSNAQLTTRLITAMYTHCPTLTTSTTTAGVALIGIIHQFDPCMAQQAPTEALDKLHYLFDCCCSWQNLISSAPEFLVDALNQVKNESKGCRNGAEDSGEDGVSGVPLLVVRALAACYERCIPYLEYLATSSSSSSVENNPIPDEKEVRYIVECARYSLISILQCLFNKCCKNILSVFEDDDDEIKTEKWSEELFSLILELSQSEDDFLSNQFCEQCSLVEQKDQTIVLKKLLLKNKGALICDFNRCYALSDTLLETSHDNSPFPSPTNMNKDGCLVAVTLGKVGMDRERLQFLSQVVAQCSAHVVASSASSSSSSSHHTDSENNQSVGKVSAQDPTEEEMSALVQEVMAVMPELGVGFLEACLASFKFNVAEVMNAIMDENLPPHLAVMDRTTPQYRVHRGKEDTKMDKSVALGMKGDQEFAAVQRDYVRKLEQGAESRHQMLMMEYNDDYDDQYDEQVKFEIGSESDFEEVKQLNKYMQEEEEEDSYWKDMRNTNREHHGRGGGGGGGEGGGAKEEKDGGEEGDVVEVTRGGKGKPSGPKQDNSKKKGKGGSGSQKVATEVDSGGDGNVKISGKDGGKGKKKNEPEGKGKQQTTELTDAQKRRKNQNKNKAHRAGAAKKQAQQQF